MTPEEKLEVWNSRWGIGGAYVFCWQCKKRQAKADWDSPFVHAADCNNASTNQIPWREVNEIKHEWEDSLKYKVIPRISPHDR